MVCKLISCRQYEVFPVVTNETIAIILQPWKHITPHVFRMIHFSMDEDMPSDKSRKM
jgi:hypothetical protein